MSLHKTEDTSGHRTGDDLSSLMGLSYDIRVTKVADGFVAVVPELAIVARGSDLNALNSEIEDKKRDYFEAMIAAGNQADIRRPARAGTRASLVKSLAPFTIKMAIAVCFVILGTLAFGMVAETQLRDLRSVARDVGRDIPRGIEEGMLDLREMSPEKQERVLNAVRAYLNSVAPIIHEVQRVLETDPAAATSEPEK